MSRIGRMPISVPAGVDVNNVNNTITVKGSKGELTKSFSKELSIELKDGQVVVTRPTDNKVHRSLHGLTRTLIANMIEGVTNGYSKALDVEGVGYRVAKQGTNLVMNLGYSHQVIMAERDGITVDVPAPNKIVINGIDKQAVGQFENQATPQQKTVHTLG